MKEVDASEGAGNAGIDIASGAFKSHVSATTNMGEDITFAHLDECQFDIVAVCKEVW
jgi:hypothetical protein